MFKPFTFMLSFFLFLSLSKQDNNFDSESYFDYSSNFDGLRGEIFDTYSSEGDYGCDQYVISEYEILCRCNATYCDKVNPIMKPVDGRFVMYTSSRGGARFLKTEGEFGSSSSGEGITLQINKSKKQQIIFGFGGAFTDSASINILSLSEAAQNNLLSSYFSSEGIEYNFGRVPIGGCDLSTHPYTLDDVPGDINLTSFKLAEEDINYKIPVIKKALSMVESGLNLIASAWSGPTWMKTVDSFFVGKLKDEYYSLWAWYHLKFLEAYQMAGLLFWAVTTGNEPFVGHTESKNQVINAMFWYPDQQSKWVAENLGPSLSDSKFNTTKIICLDDTRSHLVEYTDELLSNPRSAQYIDGIGVHWYFDNNTSPDVITWVKEKYPGKFVLNTEASQDKLGRLIPPSDAWKRAEYYVYSIIEDLNYGVNGWIEWNLASNLEGGPTWTNNPIISPIQVNAMQDEFYKLPMFYAIGHFSKFIKPGAVRLDLNQWKYENVLALACLNQDGSLVIVLSNWSPERVQTTIQDVGSGQTANILLQEYSVNTVIL